MSLQKQRVTTTEFLTLLVRTRTGGSQKWRSYYIPLNKEDVLKHNFVEGEILDVAVLSRKKPDTETEQEVTA